MKAGPVRGEWLHKQLSCPVCSESLNGAMGVTTLDPPDPGSLSICGYCASMLVFGDDLTLREPNAAEWREINGDPEIARARAAVRHLIGKRLGKR